MSWGKDQIDAQAFRASAEDYAAFEAVNLAARANVRVLDVGCFDGVNTVLKFAPYTGVSQVVGIDPEPQAVIEARALTDDARFSFCCMTLEDFASEASELFDIVYFSQVLQHVPDAQAALCRAFQLLAPGGFVVVKTVDDSAKLSYPDSDNVMHRLFALYEQHVLPNTPWTALTDRRNGQKCYTLMKRAGFDNVRIRMFLVDTAEKSLDERRALFERCVYFRRNVPACVDEATAADIHALVAAWGALFEQDDYYFASQSFVAIGQKPATGAAPWMYVGPVFGNVPTKSRGTVQPRSGETPLGFSGHDSLCERGATGLPLSMRPLVEGDLGAVMGIEIASFPDPWTPLAFALDLRHNPCAHYEVAVLQGAVIGYLGWWCTSQGAVIVRIAVDATRRKTGAGRALVERCARHACELGCATLLLEVRAANEGARVFYRRLGFEEASVLAGFYADPPDDAVVMVRALDDATLA